MTPTSISLTTSHKISWMGFICSCLVVSIHVVHPEHGFPAMLDRLLAGGVARIAVPAFFCISGYLIGGKLVQRGYRQELRKRFFSLLIPFYVWNIMSLLPKLLMTLLNDFRAKLSWGTSFMQFNEEKSALLLLSGVDVTRMPYCYPLWYLRNLLFLAIVSPLLLWLVRKTGWWFILLLLVVFCLHTGLRHHYSEAWLGLLTYGFSVDGLFFFSLGLMLRQDNLPWPPRHGAIVSAVVCLLTFLLQSTYDWGHFLTPLFLLSAAAVAWQMMPRTPLPKMLAQASFPIYVLHSIILGYLKFLPGVLSDTQSTIGFLMHLLVPILLSLLVSVILHRYLPTVSALVFGGR